METGSTDPAGLDAFELELRKLPGVVAVGFSGTKPDLTGHLTVGADADGEAVRAQAEQLARLYLEDAVALVISRLGSGGEAPAPGPLHVLDGATGSSRPRRLPGGRVRLLGVRLQGEQGELEVHLGYAGSRAVGRGRAGEPAAAARAVLDALTGLGWSIPFTLSSVARLALGIEGAVVVTLTGSNGARMGIGQADSADEAAVKATLQALNRYLEDPGRLPEKLSEPTPSAPAAVEKAAPPATERAAPARRRGRAAGPEAEGGSRTRR